MPTKLLLCDAPEALAQLQYALLTSGAAPDVEAVTDGFRAVEVAARTRPVFAIVAVELDGLSGAELVRRLRASVPGTSVICRTRTDSPLFAAELLSAGASAIVRKQDGPQAVIRAMRSVHVGGVALSSGIARELGFRLTREAARGEQLDATLADLNRQLDILVAAKADFLANISHELRTPVTVATGLVYVLRNDKIAGKEREQFLGRLEAALGKLTMLIEEVLTIADLDRGTLTLEAREIDLAPILGHVADEMRRQYPQIAIELEVPETLTGAADAVRFAEIVRQLIDNACRYSPDDRPVHLRGRALDEGVLITITDRGDGLPRGIAAKAFDEPFTAGEEILTKERSGAGVGLHLARQLVLRHGGIMWTDPLPAGGTRVSFVLPAHEGDRVPLVQPSTSATSS
jgi:signal transduction histidine kinase